MGVARHLTRHGGILAFGLHTKELQCIAKDWYSVDEKVPEVVNQLHMHRKLEKTALVSPSVPLTLSTNIFWQHVPLCQGRSV